MANRHLILFANLVPLVALTAGCAIFPGFGFTLQEGDFWEYGWDLERQYVDAYTTSTTEDSSEFRITLGEPILIDGIQSFPTIYSGNGDYVKGHCTHVAVQNDKVYCSPDGEILIDTFDANDGLMIGYGFFTTLNETALFQVQPGQISNDYINTDAYVSSISTESSNCEYYEDFGTTICGGEYDETSILKEYYIEGIGPIGAYYYKAVAGTDWFSNRTTNIGLLSSSLRGDDVDYDFEIEPNNLLANATKILWYQPMVGQRPIMKGENWGEVEFGGERTFSFVDPTIEVEDNDSPSDGQYLMALPARVTGFSTSYYDESFTIDIIDVPGLPNYSPTIEDWYRFHLPFPATLAIDLDFPHNNFMKPDIDLFLVSTSDNWTTATIHAFSVVDNPASEIYSESIEVTVGAGYYYIGVELSRLQGYSGSVPYSLNIKEAGQITSVDVVDIYEVEVPGDFTPPNWVEITGSPSIVIMDESGPVGDYSNRDAVYGRRLDLSLMRLMGLIDNRFYIGVTDEDDGIYRLELQGGPPPPT